MSIETSSIADAIKAHAESMRRQSIAVPEWGNATIWFDPLTCGDIDRLDNFKAPGEYNVQMLIYKAEDANGKKLFTLADKRALLSAPHAVINRVCLAISTAGYGRIDQKTNEKIEKLGEP